MTVIQDPPAINFLVINQANGISPAAVLTDATGALFGVPLNPISVTGVVTASNPSVGATGVAVPGFATQVGGPNPAGLLIAPRITTVAPLAADPGMVVRQVGTVAVSAPGGAALALDATLTSGAMLAQVAGTGVAGTPAVGVVTVQGIAGSTPLRVEGALTNNGAAPGATNVGVLPAVANAAAPVLTEGRQVLLSTDLAGNLRVAATFTPSGTQTVAGNLTNNNAAPAATNIGALVAVANAAAQTWTEGNEVLESVDLSGAQRVTGGQTGTATLSNVAASAASVSLLAANTSRKGVIIVNDGNKTLYVKYGATASLTSFTVLMPSNSYWEMPWPIFTGALDGIWNTANGSARITEL
jgi:hypothetical protein